MEQSDIKNKHYNVKRTYDGSEENKEYWDLKGKIYSDKLSLFRELDILLSDKNSADKNFKIKFITENLKQLDYFLDSMDLIPVDNYWKKGKDYVKI